MAYLEKDFKGCIINPLQKNLLENNPKLKEIIPSVVYAKDDDGEMVEKIVSKNEAENILCYVIVLYDPKSPVIQAEKDLAKRKEVAASLANLKDNDEYLDSIFSCEHPLIVPLAAQYLMHFAKNKYWAAICACEYTFWESITKLMEPINGKDSKTELESVDKKGKIKNEMDSDILRLEQYYSKFFGDDGALEEKAKPKLTPEGMAKMFK